MNVTIQQIYDCLKILDEANEGVQSGIGRLGVERADLNGKDAQLTAGLKEENALTEVERLKANTLLANIKTEVCDLDKKISALRYASSVLINLKTFITSVNTLENGNLVISSEAFTYFVTEGISRYSTFDFEKNIKSLLANSQNDIADVNTD